MIGMRQIYLFWLIFGIFTSCTSVFTDDIVDLTKGKSSICHLHKVRMRKEKVYTITGEAKGLHRPEYAVYCPNKGGAVPVAADGEKYALIWVCPQCLNAFRWGEQHDFSWGKEKGGLRLRLELPVTSYDPEKDASPRLAVRFFIENCSKKEIALTGKLLANSRSIQGAGINHKFVQYFRSPQPMNIILPKHRMTLKPGQKICVHRISWDKFVDAKNWVGYTRFLYTYSPFHNAFDRRSDDNDYDSYACFWFQLEFQGQKVLSNIEKIEICPATKVR